MHRAGLFLLSMLSGLLNMLNNSHPPQQKKPLFLQPFRPFACLILRFVCRMILYGRRNAIPSYRQNIETMKYKLLPKHILIVAAIFSLGAFAFVNLDARETSCTEHAAAKSGVPMEQQQEESEDRKLKTPDVMVLTRIIELVHKFANTAL
jgi:hypothetical protein